MRHKAGTGAGELGMGATLQASSDEIKEQREWNGKGWRIKIDDVQVNDGKCIPAQTA